MEINTYTHINENNTNLHTSQVMTNPKCFYLISEINRITIFYYIII